MLFISSSELVRIQRASPGQGVAAVQREDGKVVFRGKALVASGSSRSVQAGRIVFLTLLRKGRRQHSGEGLG